MKNTYTPNPEKDLRDRAGCRLIGILFILAIWSATAYMIYTLTNI